ncbi:MAG: hypothetical protein CVV17_08140, partial [Gammaproteobacteria bacterium HGW-Gammaproteobacteria-7]
MSKLAEKVQRELIQAIDNDELVLPTLPEVALKVREAAEDPDIGIAQLSKVIGNDAALTARIVKVVNSPLLRDWLDGNPVNKEDMLRHDKWLCLMWPRLKLLHELLSERGSIWITLDDNEVHHARAMLDEIFGEQNFVATCIWQKNYSPKNTAQFFSEDHDHLLVIAKNRGLWRPNLLERTEEMEARYSNPDNDPRGPWKAGDLSARNHYSEGTYAIECPGGRVIAGPPAGMFWRVKKSKLHAMDEDNRIWWG